VLTAHEEVDPQLILSSLVLYGQVVRPAIRQVGVPDVEAGFEAIVSLLLQTKTQCRQEREK